MGFYISVCPCLSNWFSMSGLQVLLFPDDGAASGIRSENSTPMRCSCILRKSQRKVNPLAYWLLQSSQQPQAIAMDFRRFVTAPITWQREIFGTAHSVSKLSQCEIILTRYTEGVCTWIWSVIAFSDSLDNAWRQQIKGGNPQWTIYHQLWKTNMEDFPSA